MTVWISKDKNETQGLFDPCACTSQDDCCTTELYLSVDKLKKKKKTNNMEDSGKEETVLVYRGQGLCDVQSVTCLNWQNLHPCSTADAW